MKECDLCRLRIDGWKVFVCTYWFMFGFVVALNIAMHYPQLLGLAKQAIGYNHG